MSVCVLINKNGIFFYYCPFSSSCSPKVWLNTLEISSLDFLTIALCHIELKVAHFLFQFLKLTNVYI